MPTRYFRKTAGGREWLRGTFATAGDFATTVEQNLADLESVYGVLECVEVADGQPDPRSGTLVEAPPPLVDPDEVALRTALTDGTLTPTVLRALIRRVGIR